MEGLKGSLCAGRGQAWPPPSLQAWGGLRGAWEASLACLLSPAAGRGRPDWGLVSARRTG